MKPTSKDLKQKSQQHKTILRTAVKEYAKQT